VDTGLAITARSNFGFKARCDQAVSPDRIVLEPPTANDETALSQAHDPLILEQVSLTLPSAAGPVEILRGLDLRIAAGERVALTGPSGSGKSSLIAVAAGLETPTAGVVRLFGCDLARLDEDGRARLRRGRVSLVFQAFHLLPSMTAEENVAAPLEIARATGAQATAREWLDRVGLTARLRHYPHQLSGGEQQRVALARALACGPELVFADEPTGNLDAANAARVADLLFGLVAETGAALVMVTHEDALAGRADRVVRLRDGRVAEPA
jgi:putative ABC transport system ATP-binding protein